MNVDETLIRAAQVAQLYGVQVGTIRKWLCDGDDRIPPPVIQQKNFTRWRRRDVLARIEELAQHDSKGTR
jgi:predicted DNA-binding transcriptional regulator AlpA